MCIVIEAALQRAILFEHRVAASLIEAEEVQVLHAFRIRLTKVSAPSYALSRLVKAREST
jgi:hypothetical protein